MTKKFKKRLSDIVFGIVIVAMIIPTSREWLMRQFAFSPSLNNTEEMEQLSTYDWDLKGLNTENYNFNEAKGKVVFVNFWATWCPPCRAEMPMIQSFYDNYKDKVEFIFVTSDNEAEIQAFFNENGYNIPSYNSISVPPVELSKTNSIPASYLINKEGKIIIDKVGAADWNSKKFKNLINELLKK